MKWKSPSINIKLLSGFFILLVMVAVFVIFSYESFGRLANKTAAAYERYQIYTEIVQREAEINDWDARIKTFLADAPLNGTTIETDSRKCSFGRWLFGTGRKEAASSFPALAPLLKKMEEPHARMHAVAGAILQSRHQSGNELDNILLQVREEQSAWEITIIDALLDDQKTLESLQLDPDQCRLGKWMNSDNTRTLYLANPEFAQLIQQLEPIHRRLHGSMSDIGKFLMSGDRLGAIEYYKRAAEPVFRKTESLVDEIIQWQAGQGIMNTADDIYSRELLPAMQQVRDLLGSAKQEIQKYTPSPGSFSSIAGKTRDTIGIAGAIVLVIGILIAFVTARLTGTPKVHPRGDSSRKEKAKGNKPKPPAMVRSGEALPGLGIRAERASEDLRAIFDKINASAESQKDKTASTTRQIKALATNGSALSDTNALLDEIISQLSQMAKNASGTIETIIREMEQQDIAPPESLSFHENQSHPGISGKLSLLVETITEISEQTNLLSLNASIEAARTGTHGKGFSLIAEEAGELAHRSSDAAREISRFLQEPPQKSADGDQKAGAGLDDNSSINGNVQPPAEAQNFTSLTEMLANLTGEIKDLAERLKTIIENANEQTREINEHLEAIAVDLDQVEEESSVQVQLVSQARENVNFINESMAELDSLSGSSTDSSVEHEGLDAEQQDENTQETAEDEKTQTGELSVQDNGSQLSPVSYKDAEKERKNKNEENLVSFGQEQASVSTGSEGARENETGSAGIKNQEKLIKKRLKKAMLKYSKKG